MIQSLLYHRQPVTPGFLCWNVGHTSTHRLMDLWYTTFATVRQSEASKDDPRGPRQFPRYRQVPLLFCGVPPLVQEELLPCQFNDLSQTVAGVKFDDNCV